MANLSSLIRKSDQLFELEFLLSSIEENEHTIPSLNIHKQEMIRLWESFREYYNEVLEDCDSKKSPVLEIKKKYSATYTVYVRNLSHLDSMIENLTQIKKASSSVIPTHLPPCDTEIFSGDYKSWPTFRDMFSALYRNNEHLSDIQKMYYLMQKTSGEARDVIRTCPITKDGFAMAWQNLVDRYENKRVLVNAQLKTLFNLAPISKESGPTIKQLQRTLNDCITNLTLLSIDTKNWDAIFVFICSTRLPEVTLGLWEQSQGSSSELPKWHDMDKFLTSRYQTLESVSDIKGSHTNPTPAKSSMSKPKPNDNRKYKSFATSVPGNTHHKPPVLKCPFCPESHPLRICPIFLRMTVNERIRAVKTHKCCTNCLAVSHELKKCQSSNVCFTCGQKHHSLLHRHESTVVHVQEVNRNITPSNHDQQTPTPANQLHDEIDARPSTSSAARSFQTFATQFETSSFSTVILGTAMVDVYIHGVRCSVRALIDPASQASFISRKLQRKLSLPIFSAPGAEIVGLNGAIASTATQRCSITLKSPIDHRFEVTTEAYLVEKLTGRLPTYSWSRLSDYDLPEINMSDLKCTHMDLLLGGDIYSKIMLTDVQKYPNGDLIAQRTVFGWIVTGKVTQTECLQSISSFYSKLDINDQLARFWEIEEVPQASPETEDDIFCEELYRKTTFRNEEGRYVVSLPFKPDYPLKIQLGYSRNIAVSQFYRNELRLLKTPDVKSQYDTVIEEYKSLGHMSKVKTYDSSIPTYYLPHHAVFKPESKTTKLRVVFNASSASSNGISLNNILYPGPILQSDLTILALRWRLFRYVFNADIEKMYRQIFIHPNHTSYQRLVHRMNPTDEVQELELNTVTFGVNCAPYLAIRTLLQLAEDSATRFPLAAQIIREQMYVDDVLAGCHSLEEAISARNELIQVLKSAGFDLRKWTSNTKALLDNISPDHILDSEFLKISDASNAKTLGLRWNALKDVFYFKLSSTPVRSVVTKRAVLSEIAKLFDPAGWLAPKIIVAKIIMQQIWIDKTDWDDCLKPLTLNRWLAFLDDYAEIERITIPRWVGFNPEHTVELHAFCDASEKAYAATLYIRIHNPSGSYTTHLLAAKTKVAPIKVETLPRLELCGATLLAKMVKALVSNLNLTNLEAFYWTDSTIVLSWLQKSPCHWPTFVANRVALISENVGTKNWHHVVSHDNPADIASRGITARDLLSNDLWWKGPAWLRLPREEWPKESFTIMTNLETRKIKTHFSQMIPSEEILTRFSSLPRALRIVAYMFRFFHRIHPKKKMDFVFTSMELNKDELEFVKVRLLTVCQKANFPEYNVLESGSTLSRKSPLLPFNPFIDSQGCMRMNGRLAHSPTLTYNERFPKLLPYSGRFTRLYAEYVHKYSVHGENSLVMRLIRQEFWVPRLKNLVKTIVQNCRICVLYRKRSAAQIMAALPKERTTISRPFNCTGVDFAGPFDIKSYIGRGCRITKGYVLVFVCFSTKAIHLEATNDLTTNGFIAAFTRFFSRRGCPAKMVSDNGTAFVGASNVFEKDQTQFLYNLKSKILANSAFQLMEWQFNPPGAPHMGGLWEAGVKSVKSHLKKMSHSQKFTFEEFSTVLARIEACLNSRPLCPMSENPSDLNPLTPGHFLIGNPLLSPPEPNLSTDSISYVNRWQKLKILHNLFAQRWKDEYLVELHKRNKWKFPQKDLQINDMVVIRNENLPPNEWKIGRVDKVYLGSDLKVRVADIRTANGLLTRPIVKLVLLPIAEQ